MRKETKKQIVNALSVIIGTFILAVSVEVFIIPYHILSGGVAGIAVALEPFIHVPETLIANILLVVRMLGILQVLFSK